MTTEDTKREVASLSDWELDDEAGHVYDAMTAEFVSDERVAYLSGVLEIMHAELRRRGLLL
jgi:acyl-CoA thioesterase FadM